MCHAHTGSEDLKQSLYYQSNLCGCVSRIKASLHTKAVSTLLGMAEQETEPAATDAAHILTSFSSFPLLILFASLTSQERSHSEDPGNNPVLKGAVF